MGSANIASYGPCMICRGGCYKSRTDDGYYCGCEDCDVCGQPFCDIQYEDRCVVCDVVIFQSPEDGHVHNCGCADFFIPVCDYCGDTYYNCGEMVLYRAIRPDEWSIADRGHGLPSKDPAAKISMTEHVLNGQNLHTQYISATYSCNVLPCERHYREGREFAVKRNCYWSY
jgi:hypothetical protein